MSLLHLVLPTAYMLGGEDKSIHYRNAYTESKVLRRKNRSVTHRKK